MIFSYKLFLSAIICCFACPFSFGKSINVGNNALSDFNDIQSAIDVAENGDVIIVQPGLYYGNGNRDIDFKGKSITLKSSEPNNLEIVYDTIIDCQASNNDPHRGFYFYSGESKDSILSGFTIVGGYTHDSLVANYGGGIYCSNGSSPTISNCIISSNTAGRGGGIYCNSASPIIINCIISGNNISVTGGPGGGIYCINAIPSIKNCIISNNFGYHGAGIYCDHSSPSIYNCLVVGNWTPAWGGTGGGIRANFSSHPIISNCTISNNSSYSGGGIHCKQSSSAVVENSIIWNNSAISEYSEIGLDSGCSITVNFSNIKGGWTGNSNYDEDPIFVVGPLGDYSLSQIASGQQFQSICVDAGSDYVNQFDISQFPTRTDGLQDTNIIDIGYHYSTSEPPKYTLTVNTDPNNVAIYTVNPSEGNHDVVGWVSLKAERFVDCPSVYVFDHWIGDVANSNSANTMIVMDSDKTVTAVFIDGRECGDECHPYPLGDLSKDCSVDLGDIAVIAQNWLECTKPECD